MLTLVIVTFGQPIMLAKHLEVICSYSDDVREQIKVVIVDDSGQPPAKIPQEALDKVTFELYRVLDNIAWNQMGARNLGMTRSSGWCVMLDVDMVLPPNQICDFIKLAGESRRGTVYRFALVRLSGINKGKINQTSPNTYLIHRDDFMECGGYDEDYAGNKGWSDVQLLHTLGDRYKVIMRTSLYADFYLPGDGIADANVQKLNRSVERNGVIHKGKVKLARRMGWKTFVKDRKGKNIRFKWERLI